MTPAIPFAVLSCNPDGTNCQAKGLSELVPSGSVAGLVQLPSAPAQAPAVAAGGTAAAASPASTASSIASGLAGTASNLAVSLLGWVGNNLVLVLVLAAGYWFFFRRHRR